MPVEFMPALNRWIRRFLFAIVVGVAVFIYMLRFMPDDFFAPTQGNEMVTVVMVPVFAAAFAFLGYRSPVVTGVGCLLFAGIFWVLAWTTPSPATNEFQVAHVITLMCIAGPICAGAWLVKAGWKLSRGR
ncbi:MAG: hypothetical protein JWN64_595 [Parcubacteria group bacterium]|nr:hypothetical protein [Parcubacteria group bacterium]